MALDTGEKITRFQWTELPTPMAIIERVNRIGKNKPSILTFTNWHGDKTGDTTQDFYPGVEDESDIDPLADEFTGVDNTNDRPTETDFDGEPTGVDVDTKQEWRLKLIMVRYMSQFPKKKETMVLANKSLKHQRQLLILLPYNGQIA